jgi:CHRD domain
MTMKNRRVIAAFASGALAALGVGVAVGAQSNTAQGGGADFTRFATLTGDNEIGTNGQRGAGDANGKGSFSAIIDGRKLCYGITVANIGDPLAAHIHKGARTSNGDVIVPLKQPKAGDPGASSQCVNVPDSFRDDFSANPRQFYVNVHNRKFPNGAIRGQVGN